MPDPVTATPVDDIAKALGNLNPPSDGPPLPPEPPPAPESNVPMWKTEQVTDGSPEAPSPSNPAPEPIPYFEKKIVPPAASDAVPVPPSGDVPAPKFKKKGKAGKILLVFGMFFLLSTISLVGYFVTNPAKWAEIRGRAATTTTYECKPSPSWCTEYGNGSVDVDVTNCPNQKCEAPNSTCCKIITSSGGGGGGSGGSQTKKVCLLTPDWCGEYTGTVATCTPACPSSYPTCCEVPQSAVITSGGPPTGDTVNNFCCSYLAGGATTRTKVCVANINSCNEYGPTAQSDSECPDCTGSGNGSGTGTNNCGTQNCTSTEYCCVTGCRPKNGLSQEQVCGGGGTQSTNTPTQTRTPTPTTAVITDNITSTPTPTTIVTDSPTPTPVPRVCNEYCTTNETCATGLSCVTTSGSTFCRNASCQEEYSCTCPNATNTPTSTPTPTTVVLANGETATPTPTTVVTGSGAVADASVNTTSGEAVPVSGGLNILGVSVTLGSILLILLGIAL